MPSRPVLTPTYSDHTSMTSNEGKKAFNQLIGKSCEATHCVLTRKYGCVIFVIANYIFE